VLIGKALDKKFSNSDLISRAMSEAEQCFLFGMSLDPSGTDLAVIIFELTRLRLAH